MVRVGYVGLGFERETVSCSRHLRLRQPVLVIPQKISLVKRIQRRLQEHPHDVSVTHLLEAAVRGENPSIDQAEAVRRYFLG